MTKRCLRNDDFPVGLNTWCKNTTKFGPKALPPAKIGGFLCCAQDKCNLDLKPKILQFINGELIEYEQGVNYVQVFKRNPLFMIFSMI
jgi:hypothetical protein